MNLSKRILSISLLCLCTCWAQAQPYGNYDIRQALVSTEQGEHHINITYVNQVFLDLHKHARSYPPQFDTPQDQQRATQDASMVAKVFETLLQSQPDNVQILERTSMSYYIAHNLDIPGAAHKANTIYRQWVTLMPNDPQGNYMYGEFLSSIGDVQTATPFLEKALELGQNEANFALGLNALRLGDTQGAIVFLQEYQKTNPQNTDVQKIIEAIQSGSIEVHQSPGPGIRP